MHQAFLFSNIQKHIHLTSSEILHLASKFEEKYILRKELLLNQGSPCRDIFFIAAGSLRAFHRSQDGRESTIMFGIKDWWITDMNCFINQKPALLNIIALEDSIVFKLDFNVLEQLYTEIPKFEKYFRILMQNAYIREQQRILENITYSSEERYNRFVTKYPFISQKVTQKEIASYLGITPEFLSSIKRKSHFS